MSYVVDGLKRQRSLPYNVNLLLNLNTASAIIKPLELSLNRKDDMTIWHSLIRVIFLCYLLTECAAFLLHCPSKKYIFTNLVKEESLSILDQYVTCFSKVRLLRLT
jgi:hypothetical protein